MDDIVERIKIKYDLLPPDKKTCFGNFVDFLYQQHINAMKNIEGNTEADESKKQMD